MHAHHIRPFMLIAMVLTLVGCAASSPPVPEEQAQPAAAEETAGQDIPASTDTVTDTSTVTNTATSTATASLSQSSILMELETRLHGIYERVSPSVVNIRVVQQRERPPQTNIPGMPFELPEQQPREQQPDEFFAQGQGSGFVWDSEGHIVTNDHVVAEADRISVTFADGTIADAELVGTDRDSDLAVVQVDLEADQLRPIEVAGSDGVEVGDLVVALGNPFGLENTMTVGFVSALGRSLPVQASGMGPTYSIPDVIQTDASINPGNSGGAMVNHQGQLVGVPSAIRSPVRASVGVGFAIPSAIVQKVVPALIETGTYTHPWLGISGLPLTPDIARAMNLEPDQRGALVVTVVDGSPADEAGLRGSDREVTIQGQTVRVGGDVITQFNNRPVNEFTDLIAYLERYTEVGDEVDLTILRDGAPQTVTVTLQGRPSQETRQASRADAQAPWLGIIGITLVPEIAERMDYPTDQDGVLVVRVEAGSPADEAGLRGSFRSATIEGQPVLIGGDIIIAFNGEPVSDVEALRSALQQASTGETVTLTILRDGEEQEIEATLVERPNS